MTQRDYTLEEVLDMVDRSKEEEAEELEEILMPGSDEEFDDLDDEGNGMNKH